MCGAWGAKIKLAWDAKKQFREDAEEAMRFLDGPYDWLYGIRPGQKSSGMTVTGDDDAPRPKFAVTINKTSELVQLFGPALYHKNPVRQVNPRTPPEIPEELWLLAGDPQAAQMQMMMAKQQEMQRAAVDRVRAVLLEKYLNYTPEALDLKVECRWAIDEGLIKGMALLWTEVYQPAGAPFKMIGSFWDTVDNLVIDPDAECVRDAKWVARRCVHPYWEVEQEYGLPKDSLKGKATLESVEATASVTAGGVEGDYNRRTGQTNDLIVYWKVYSKMGVGDRLKGVRQDLAEFQQLGNYVYLVICESVQWPLNLPPEVSASGNLEEIQRRLQWPTPFWADDAWPFSELAFHPVPRRVWPINHLKPAIGELTFLNWAYSFLAGKVRTASRDFIAVAKSAAAEIKSQIQTGQDYTFVEVEAIHDSVDKVVKFLQHPGFNPEIYTVIQGIEANFEKRTGLTELAYGMSARQMRSAEEASIKSDAIAVRPDDMANKVEDWMSAAARKEAFACRWHLTGDDVRPVLGDVGAQLWNQFVMPSDPAEIIHGLEYRIEAGSVKKPNRASKIADMGQILQNMGPVLQSYAMATGDMGPLNNLFEDVAKANDVDPSRYLLSPPPPPPPPPQAAPPVGPDGQPVQGPPQGAPPMPPAQPPMMPPMPM